MKGVARLLVVHAKIYTMQGQVLEDGYLCTKGKKIASLGETGTLAPAELSGADVVDAHGAMLLPGFIDAHTHMGLFEDSLGFEGDDGNEDTDPCTPQLRAIDAVNPLDKSFEEAVQAGVTTVLTGPGSANPIGGQFAAMKTGGVCVDDMVIRAPAAMKFALGENPKSVYHEKNTAPVTRMATAAMIREQLIKAREYMQKRNEDEPPEYDIKCEALIPLLRGEIPAQIHAHRADDIFTAVRLAKEFGLRYTIVHCTQGFLVADGLAKKGASAMCGPLLTDRCKPELHGATPANPAALQSAGVKICIVTDHPEVPVQYLPLSAGLAVREGLDYMEALRAITIYPAELCGIAGRVGSLAPGKDADFSLFGQDPLTIAAKPEMVCVDGKIVFDRRRNSCAQ